MRDLKYIRKKNTDNSTTFNMNIFQRLYGSKENRNKPLNGLRYIFRAIEIGRDIRKRVTCNN